MKIIQKKVKELEEGDRLEYGVLEAFSIDFAEENTEVFYICDFCFENGNIVDEDCSTTSFELEYFTQSAETEYQSQVSDDNVIDGKRVNIENFVVNVIVD